MVVRFLSNGGTHGARADAQRFVGPEELVVGFARWPPANRATWRPLVWFFPPVRM